MSYPARPDYGCKHCGEYFFTPYALAAHIAQKHYQHPGEREERLARIRRNSELAKESRVRNGTPTSWIRRAGA